MRALKRPKQTPPPPAELVTLLQSEADAESYFTTLERNLDRDVEKWKQRAKTAGWEKNQLVQHEDSQSSSSASPSKSKNEKKRPTFDVAYSTEESYQEDDCYDIYQDDCHEYKNIGIAFLARGTTMTTQREQHKQTNHRRGRPSRSSTKTTRTKTKKKTTKKTATKPKKAAVPCGRPKKKQKRADDAAPEEKFQFRNHQFLCMKAGCRNDELTMAKINTLLDKILLFMEKYIQDQGGCFFPHTCLAVTAEDIPEVVILDLNNDRTYPSRDNRATLYVTEIPGWEKIGSSMSIIQRLYFYRKKYPHTRFENLKLHILANLDECGVSMDDDSQLRNIISDFVRDEVLDDEETTTPFRQFFLSLCFAGGAIYSVLEEPLLVVW